MFKIGEFSQLAQVTVRTLRHYDDLGLLQPAYIAPENDYRYYIIDQLPRLHRIVALKELGLTLEQIAQILDKNLSADQISGMLVLRQAELAQHIQEKQVQLERVTARLRQIECDGSISPYEVMLKPVVAQTVIAIRQLVPTLEDIPRYRCAFYAEIYQWLARQGIKSPGAELALYYNTEYTEQEIDMEAAVVIPASSSLNRNRRMVVKELPARAVMASVTYHGNLSEIGQAISALIVWMEANNYTADGPCRELHRFGRENEMDNRNDLVIELQIPVIPCFSQEKDLLRVPQQPGQSSKC